MLTPDEAYEKIQEIAPCFITRWEQLDIGDNCEAHQEVDDFLIELVRRLGYTDLADYVTELRVGFWYD